MKLEEVDAQEPSRKITQPLLARFPITTSRLKTSNGQQLLCPALLLFQDEISLFFKGKSSVCMFVSTSVSLSIPPQGHPASPEAQPERNLSDLSDFIFHVISTQFLPLNNNARWATDGPTDQQIPRYFSQKKRRS